MSQDTGKQIYEIFRAVMQDAPYRDLSGNYREKLDALQALSETFSNEQWNAIREYIDIAAQIHQAMMEIALKTTLSEQE